LTEQISELKARKKALFELNANKQKFLTSLPEKLNTLTQVISSPLPILLTLFYFYLSYFIQMYFFVCEGFPADPKPLESHNHTRYTTAGSRAISTCTPLYSFRASNSL
jgi:hypothetical protein